jgi:tetratricopeptide (TPR) repeat protein
MDRNLERRIIPHLHAAFNNAVAYLSTNPEPISNQPPPIISKGTSGQYLYRLFEICEGWYFWMWGKVEDFRRYFLMWCSSNIESGSDIWRLAYKLGPIYRKQQHYSWEEAIYRWALSEAKMRFSQKHPASLEIVGDLARSIYVQKRYDEALAWYNWTYTVRKNVLGSTHRATMGALLGIAHIYGEEKRFEETEQLIFAAYTWRERKLGKEDFLTLNSASILGTLLSDEGDYDQALERRNCALVGYEKSRGVKHLAGTYEKQKRWVEAEQLYVQVVETRKTVFGQEHPDTLDSMHYLARTYIGQERWVDAEQLCVQVVETSKTVLSQEHPDTLDRMYTLAFTYGKRKRWVDAEQLSVQVVETRKTVLGQEHPDTLDSMHYLAWT